MIVEREIPSPPRTARRGNPKRNAAIATFGNAIEWFDFTIFGFFALPISQVFFPSQDPVTGLLATFGAFGVGFVARPIGAIVFGRLGDRRGRRFVLITSISLMAAASFIIGVAPTYAAVGLLGPALLICGRLMQGLSAGAEFGTAVAYLVEWAPKNRRGLYGSLHQVGASVGLIVGALIAAVVNTLLGPETILQWGWRVPFLLGSVLALGALILRLSLEESPEFEAIAHVDAAMVRRSLTVPCLQTIGVCALWTVAFYASVLFLPTFAVQQGGLSPSMAMWGTVISSIFVLPAVVVGGLMTDRFGVRAMLLIPVIGYLALAIPGFMVVANARSFASALPVMILFGVLAGFISGIGPSAVGGLFPTGSRSTWLSIASAVPVALFGGFAPFLSTLLIERTGWAPAPSLYVMAMAVVTGITALTLSRRSRVSADLAPSSLVTP